jgi:hypothetical protein
MKFKESLLNSVSNRLGFILEKNNLALKAAAMDPRFGHLSFISPALRDEIWVSLQKEMINLLPDEQNESNSGIPMISWSPEQYQEISKSYLLLLRSNLEKNSAQFAHVDPLQWWASQLNLAILHPLAQMLLAIPATSANVERLFSSTGFLNSGRAALHGSTLEKLATIRHFRQHRQANEWEAVLKQLFEKTSK